LSAVDRRGSVSIHADELPQDNGGVTGAQDGTSRHGHAVRVDGETELLLCQVRVVVHPEAGFPVNELAGRHQDPTEPTHQHLSPPDGTRPELKSDRPGERKASGAADTGDGRGPESLDG
jgi:hypothetical protein